MRFQYSIKLTFEIYSKIFSSSGDDSTTLPDTKQPVENGATYKEKVCTRSKFNDFKLCNFVTKSLDLIKVMVTNYFNSQKYFV